MINADCSMAANHPRFEFEFKLRCMASDFTSSIRTQFAHSMSDSHHRMNAVLGAVGRPAHAALIQLQVEGKVLLKDTPLCHASPRPPVGDFGGFGWVNRRGIWGACI